MSAVSETPLTVRYAETDQMGIVHHSRYYPWFEMGRTEFVKQAGISYGGMERDGVLLPLTETWAKYLHGARYEDELIVETKLTALGVVRCTFSYRVLRPCDDAILALGRTNHAFTDAAFAPINLKKKRPQLWERLDALVWREE